MGVGCIWLCVDHNRRGPQTTGPTQGDQQNMSTDDDTPDEGLPENLGEEVSEGTSLQEAVEQLRDEVDQPFDVLSESIKEYMVENTDLTTDEDLTVIVDVEEDDVAFTRGVGDGGLNVVFSGIDNEGE